MNKVATVATTAEVLSDSANVAQTLSEQYRLITDRTNGLIRECIKFGAMLIQWERFLGTSNAGRSSSGEGLKGWMALNCPEINYKTAFGYKNLAAKNLQLLGGGEAALAALQDKSEITDPSGKPVDISQVIQHRESIFEQADSRRKLEQMYYNFMGVAVEGKPGRPKGSKSAPVTRLTDEEAAQQFWAKTLDDLQRHSVALQSAAGYLTASQCAAALTVLGDLTAALEHQQQELEGV